MTTPAESTMEWVRGWQRDISSQLNALGNRISSWLVLGNAAALVLAFKAIIEPGNCARELVLPSIWYFVAGLCLAFGGALASYLVSLRALSVINQLADLINILAINEYYIAKLESEGIEVPDDAPLQVQMTNAIEQAAPLQKKLPMLWFGFWIVASLFLLSAVSFAAGVISPLQREMTPACVSNQKASLASQN